MHRCTVHLSAVHRAQSQHYRAQMHGAPSCSAQSTVTRAMHKHTVHLPAVHRAQSQHYHAQMHGAPSCSAQSTVTTLPCTDAWCTFLQCTEHSHNITMYHAQMHGAYSCTFLQCTDHSHKSHAQTHSAPSCSAQTTVTTLPCTMHRCTVHLRAPSCSAQTTVTRAMHKHTVHLPAVHRSQSQLGSKGRYGSCVGGRSQHYHTHALFTMLLCTVHSQHYYVQTHSAPCCSAQSTVTTEPCTAAVYRPVTTQPRTDARCTMLQCTDHSRNISMHRHTVHLHRHNTLWCTVANLLLHSALQQHITHYPNLFCTTSYITSELFF